MNYNGEDTLKTIKKAKNYNAALVRLIVSAYPETARNVIDFGSGDGYFARIIAQKKNINVLCFEPAKNMLSYYSETEKDISLTETTADISSACIDFIYSLNVLEHIESDVDIIEEFHRILEQNGKVLLYLPAFSCLYSTMDKHVGHYRRYQMADVSRLFSTDKWEIKRVRYADFLGFFASLLYKYSNNKAGNINIFALLLYDKFIFPFSNFLDKITFGKICGKNLIIEAVKK